MDFTEDMLKSAALSEKHMEEDLKILASYYDGMEIRSHMIPPTQLLPLPTLTAILTDKSGFSRIISHSWLAMPRAAAEFTKYLQYYSELQLPEIERGSLLEGLTIINEQLPLGHCFLVKPENQPDVIGVRWTQSFPMEEVPDQGCFTDGVLLFDYSCQLVQDFLNILADGKTASEALKELQ